MVSVGDKVRFVPCHGAGIDDGSGITERPRAVSGTVVYVNQAHRFFLVEAEVGIFGYKLRECFKF